MTKVKAGQPNLLEGKLFPKIVAFILPLMLTNLLQTLYNAADMIVVGLSNVEGALGAIGTTGAMINLIVNVFMGFSVGANVVVARNIGAGERGETQRSVHTALVTAVVFGFLGCAIGQAVCRPMLILLGDEGHILELAELYSRIYFAGAPFLAVTNVSIGIFRAKGNTKTPLAVLSLSGVLNVLLNLFFVLVCGMSVDGVALATVIANGASAVFLVWKLCRDPGWCWVQLRKLRFHARAFREILYVGIPAALQGALFSLSNMIIQSSIVRVNNRMFPGGSAVIDGNTAASNLESFTYTATNSVYQAAVTFTSQHFGAGKFRRIGRVRLNCYAITSAIAVILGWTILLFQPFFVGLYVRDPAALEIAEIRNWIMLTVYPLLGLMEVGSGILRGMGKSVTSTVISLLGACVFRILWISFVFERVQTLQCIYWSYPLSWGLTALVFFIVGEIIWRKLVKKEQGTALQQ